MVRPEDWQPQGVDDLEPRAWQALRQTDRSVCVTAGAGAGKTEFLAQKATFLLQTGICPAPKRILAISFKRDAAQNLATRVRQRCPREQARRFHSLTFDAFTKNLLDRFRCALPDPFRPPADYDIVFPGRRDLEEFLTRQGHRNIDPQKFEQAIARVALPIDNPRLPARWLELLQAYWREMYERPIGTALSFSMINRLIHYLFATNPMISKALQRTYPIVFLDEFQDTTYSQYGLLKSAFRDGGAIFTAVGDDKQRIMGWAGAMENAFEKFTADFNAAPISLLSNWRSHTDLVAIQHVIAQNIDPNVEQVQARGELEVDGQTAALWRFESRDEEAELIASWIKDEVESGHIAPHDAAILVRMRADDVEAELSPVFKEEGLILRNLARKVDEISIQDLLAEEMTAVILPLLRLGASSRDPVAWGLALERLQALFGIGLDDELGMERLQKQIETSSRDLRALMTTQEPDQDVARDLFRTVMTFVGTDRLRQGVSAYRRERDFDRVADGFLALLRECAVSNEDWPSVLDQFEGVGQVPLMTIHKSKGLEFHTMIFFGLDARTWWSLSPECTEELNSFFVALTRARQRAFFTYCAERGAAIQWLEDLLMPAGVIRLDGDDILKAL